MRLLLFDPGFVFYEPLLRKLVKTPWDIEGEWGDEGWLRRELRGADALLSANFKPEWRGLARNLKAVFYPGPDLAQTDPSDLPAGCLLSNVFEHAAPIAEYVFYNMLRHVTRMEEHASAFRQGYWSGSARVASQTHGELCGKTISLLGYGTIGQQIARRAEAFDMKVLVKRRNHEDPGFWTDCDFLVIACPLTEDTPRIVGRYQLESLRDGAMLINIARAEIVDESALFAALSGDRELPPNTVTRTAVNTTIADLLGSPFRISPPGVTSIQRDFKPPTVYNWSFGIQQNVGYGAVLDVAYVGNVGRHLMQRRSLSALPYGTRFKPTSLDSTTGSPLPDNFSRPLPGYADIQYIELAGTSIYHSLQTQINKRFSKGLQFGLAHTWSKAMTIVDGNGSAVNPYLNYRMRNYGKADFDRTHNLIINYVYDIPKLSSLTGGNVVVKSIFNKWQLSGLTSLTSGAPLGLKNPILPKGERTELRHFDTTAFAPPTKEEFGIGNAPKDVIRGPGLQVWDFTVIKNVPFKREQMRLQLRFEFYNLFNHTNFVNVDTTARFDALNRQVSGTFGQYNSSLDARRIVLGAKFYF